MTLENKEYTLKNSWSHKLYFWLNIRIMLDVLVLDRFREKKKKKKKKEYLGL